MPNPVVDAWVEFLKPIPFVWFGSLTFRDQVVGFETADKAYRYWINRINRQIAGPRFHRATLDRLPFWIRAIEYQTARGDVIHFHVLVGHVAAPNSHLNDINFLRDHERAWCRDQGFSKVDYIRTHEAVKRYCAKAYTVKEAGGEIDLSNNFSVLFPGTTSTVGTVESDRAHERLSGITVDRGTRRGSVDTIDALMDPNRFVADRALQAALRIQKPPRKRRAPEVNRTSPNKATDGRTCGW